MSDWTVRGGAVLEGTVPAQGSKNATLPMIAAALSIAIGMDRFTWQKALAAALVFGGVFLVSRSRAAKS